MSSFASNAICTDDIVCSRELLQETVSVINEAIHPRSEPEGEFDAAAIGQRISNGRTLRVLVIDPQDLVEGGPVDIRFEQERVTLMDTDSEVVVDARVKVSRDHLQNVCTHPEAYADDPMKLELVWMKERMTG